MKRLRDSWGKVGDASQRNPSICWLALGIGPCKEGLDVAMDADKEGETLRGSGLHKKWFSLRTRPRRKDGLSLLMTANLFSGYIPLDIIIRILTKVPLFTLLLVETTCISWHAIISSSVLFHNLWAQNNMQIWLVMDLYEPSIKSSNGLALFDTSRSIWLKKIFNDEWSSSDSEWYLRAGDGGLLVYTCKKNGILKILNPLTMKFHYLEDARLSRKRRISFYIKKYLDDVCIHFKFHSKDKTYQVIAVIGNSYLVKRKRLHVLIYKSAEQRWEIRVAHFSQRVHGIMTIRHFPNILLKNQRIYCFSSHGKDVGIYHLNGDWDSGFSYSFRMQGVRHETLGIVMYKGRTMMVCKNNPRNIPSIRDTLFFYEFDEVGLRWRSEYDSVVLNIKLTPKLICCGGDCVWVIQESNTQLSHMISIDVDTRELDVWPGVSQAMFNVRNCLSMPLSFFSCT